MSHLEEHTPGLIVAVQHAVLQIPPSVGEHEHGVQLADSLTGQLSGNDWQRDAGEEEEKCDDDCHVGIDFRIWDSSHGGSDRCPRVSTWSSRKQWGCSFSDVFSASHSSHASTSSAS